MGLPTATPHPTDGDAACPNKRVVRVMPDWEHSFTKSLEKALSSISTSQWSKPKRRSRSDIAQSPTAVDGDSDSDGGRAVADPRPPSSGACGTPDLRRA